MERLAIFLPGLYGGGAERTMLKLAGGMARRGYGVDLVLVRAEGPYLAEVPAGVRLVDLRAARSILSVVSLVRYLRRERPDVLLSGLFTNVIALVAGRLARTRVVVTERNALSSAVQHYRFDTRMRLLPRLIKHLYRWADGIVAVSRGVADDLAQVTGIPRERIRVIYNPVVTPELHAMAQAPLCHPWFGPGEPPVVLAVGRLTAQKDYTTLVQAFARVRRSRMARLMILGEGEERSALEALVKQLGLEQDTSLPGFVPNPYPYMRQASVFVLSSRWEGLPGVLIEALCCGLPIVSTDCPGGPKEILADGAYGCLVPLGDMVSMASAIEAALDGRTPRPLPESYRPFEAEAVVDQYVDVLFGTGLRAPDEPNRFTPKQRSLLIVGPLPPPIGGSPLTLQAFADEMHKDPSVRLAIINTSPATDPREKMTGFNLEKVRRMAVIFAEYVRRVHGTGAVLVFANNLFALTIVPVLLLVARGFHARFYVKPVGGDLDLFLAKHGRLIQSYGLRILRSADGVLAQTQLLQAGLTRLGCSNVHYVPGCRPLPEIQRSPNGRSPELHLVFLSHIHRDKGPLVLLDALQLVAQTCPIPVSCDFYGPLHTAIREEFLRKLEVSPNSRYCGTVKVGDASQVIAGYDALVLPTFFACEGHPGVVIEAMHAGVPVISTQHSALAELVTDGENGLLVPARDPEALAQAVGRLALDPQLRDRMAKANQQRGREFSADVVVAHLLEIMFPGQRDAELADDKGAL